MVTFFLRLIGLSQPEPPAPEPEPDIPILETLDDEEKAAAEAARARSEEACKTLELETEKLRATFEEVASGHHGGPA